MKVQGKHERKDESPVVKSKYLLVTSAMRGSGFRSRDAVCVCGGEGHLFAGLGGRRFVRLLWFSSLFSVL